MMNKHATSNKDPVVYQNSSADSPLANLREMLSTCIQCGTCTASCPNAFAMDLTPRRLWRMVILGREQEVFDSKTFTLCSSCYYCTLRCPRGLPLTDAMSALKRTAAAGDMHRHRQSTLFYKQFIASVKRHGRVREMEFMTLYFNALKNPIKPFQFAGLGLKLMMKGKVSIQFPSRGKAPLEALFNKVAELEKKL